MPERTQCVEQKQSFVVFHGKSRKGVGTAVGLDQKRPVFGVVRIDPAQGNRQLRIAERTRSRDSLTAVPGSPTISKAGMDWEKSTSARTG